LLVFDENHDDNYNDIENDIENIAALPKPSLFEIQECIEILDHGRGCCTNCSCSAIAAILFLAASLYAIGDAIRRSITCHDTEDVCGKIKYPEYIVGTFGLILTVIAGVTACNTTPEVINLDTLPRSKYEKIKGIGERMGMTIHSHHSLTHTLLVFRHLAFTQTAEIHSSARQSLGLFPARQVSSAHPDENPIIVISVPVTKLTI